MEIISDKFTCKNPKCKNVFEWIGVSKWGESEPYVSPAIKITKNMCYATEHAEPNGEIFYFTLTCPLCGYHERVAFDSKNNLYLGHDEHI